MTTPPRKTKPYRDESFTVHRPYACGMSNHGDWIGGSVVTPDHLVNAYTHVGHTRLDTVHGGKHCMRTFPRRMTQTGLARAAGKWSRELAELPKAAGRGRGK